ncbi:MAG: hypothetical protein V4649_16050 [Bacteroidota bacterium]
MAAEEVLDGAVEYLPLPASSRYLVGQSRGVPAYFLKQAQTNTVMSSKIFEIASVETMEPTVYKMGGRVHGIITKGSLLSTVNGQEVSVMSILYFGKEIPYVDPWFTCYLIVESLSPLPSGLNAFFAVGVGHTHHPVQDKEHGEL